MSKRNNESDVAHIMPDQKTATLVVLLAFSSVSLNAASLRRDEQPFQFSDMTKQAGLLPGVNRIKGEKKPLAERFDRWSRIVYPLLLALVLAVSFVL